MIFVTATQWIFCRTEIATSTSRVLTGCDFNAILVQFYCRNIARFKMQPIKDRKFEQPIDLQLRRRTRLVSTRSFSLFVLVDFLWFVFTNDSENVPLNKHGYRRSLCCCCCLSLIPLPVLDEDEDIDEYTFFVCISHDQTMMNKNKLKSCVIKPPEGSLVIQKSPQLHHASFEHVRNSCDIAPTNRK